MFIGIGFPFAQEDLEIAPIEPFEIGNPALLRGTSLASGAWSQIGLGSVEVIFFVPQLTKNNAPESKNNLREEEGISA